jgi:hypothetical protein
MARCSLENSSPSFGRIRPDVRVHPFADSGVPIVLGNPYVEEINGVSVLRNHSVMTITGDCSQSMR